VAMTNYIPDQGEQMVRYYGFYSNVSRGLRQKENVGALISLQSMEILFDPSHHALSHFLQKIPFVSLSLVHFFS
jgi:hypothetical protein